MSAAAIAEDSALSRNQEATLHVGNLFEACSEDVLWELFSQMGPLERVHMPRDKVTGESTGFAFIEYQLERDADYAHKMLGGVKLYGRALRLNRAAQVGKLVDVGANLFVGGLDDQVDEKTVNDVFASFGTLITSPSVSRDPKGNSLGYGFVSFDSFEASDAAIAAMNDQYLFNKQIKVNYALKKGSTERHGSETERMLAEGLRARNAAGAEKSAFAKGANTIPLGRPQFAAAPPPPPLFVPPPGIGLPPFLPPPPGGILPHFRPMPPPGTLLPPPYMPLLPGTGLPPFMPPPPPPPMKR